MYIVIQTRMTALYVVQLLWLWPRLFSLGKNKILFMQFSVFFMPFCAQQSLGHFKYPKYLNTSDSGAQSTNPDLEEGDVPDGPDLEEGDIPDGAPVAGPQHALLAPGHRVRGTLQSAQGGKLHGTIL